MQAEVIILRYWLIFASTLIIDKENRYLQCKM